MEGVLLILTATLILWGFWPTVAEAAAALRPDEAKVAQHLSSLVDLDAAPLSKVDDGLVADQKAAPFTPAPVRFKEGDLLSPVVDTPAPAGPTPIPDPAAPVEVNGDRWIDIDLSEQLLTAYEGDTPVRQVAVSTGLPATPTPEGQFRIWIKLEADDMEGPGYYLPDVPYVMYFHMGYGLHGVYWHANFGQPMSHGCVNMPTSEAEWLFYWAEVGTLVNVHS
ncbi:MAG: L,D-transpeptidase [Anaerolineae bacterium]|jgi:lipoprotein-anchoring transpeptidase ErfK/SrfK